MATTLTYKPVKIKKERQCFSCFRKFDKGTTMHYWSGIYEGDFNSSYSCNTCKEIMDEVQKQGYDEDGFPEGFVNECLEYPGQTPELYLMKLLS